MTKSFVIMRSLISNRIVAVLGLVATAIFTIFAPIGKSFVTDPIGSIKGALEIFGASSLPDAAQKLFGSESPNPQEKGLAKQVEKTEPHIGHGPIGPYLLPEGVRVVNPNSTIPEDYARDRYSRESTR
jgi:hypothetical protein